MKRTMIAAAPMPLLLVLCFGVTQTALALSPKTHSVHSGAATHRRAWGANTSGPFYTGTAEVEPSGSFYLEPYIFDNRKSGSASDQFDEKMAIGMGHNLEFDTLIPLTRNSVQAHVSPTGKSESAFGPGDMQMSFKYELTTDRNTYRFWAKPAMTLLANFVLPTGNAAHLNPKLDGADQFGNGTFQEGVGLLVRKRFKPFVFYGQLGEMIVDPATVSDGYGYNNNIGVVPAGTGDVRMVDGNLFSYSGALEDVFNAKHGIGAVVEMTGAVQSGRNLFFGKATAPSYSYLSMAPELEFTWPAGNRFAMTWGGGVTIPVERSNYPRTVTPMMTVTFYFNGPHGSRNSS